MDYRAPARAALSRLDRLEQGRPVVAGMAEHVTGLRAEMTEIRHVHGGYKRIVYEPSKKANNPLPLCEREARRLNQLHEEAVAS